MVIFRSYVTIYQRVLNVSVENSDSLHDMKTEKQPTGKEGDSTKVYVKSGKSEMQVMLQRWNDPLNLQE